MTKEEWITIQDGQTIYSLRSGRPRTVGRFCKRSKTVRFENGVVYASCDCHMFSLNPPAFAPSQEDRIASLEDRLEKLEKYLKITFMPEVTEPSYYKKS